MLSVIPLPTRNSEEPPWGTNLRAINFPAEMDKELMCLVPFRLNIEVDLNHPRVGIDSESLVREIERKGYSIHGRNVFILH